MSARSRLAPVRVASSNEAFVRFAPCRSAPFRIASQSRAPVAFARYSQAPARFVRGWSGSHPAFTPTRLRPREVDAVEVLADDDRTGEVAAMEVGAGRGVWPEQSR